jgi:putative RecB family exonuclease
VLQQWNRARWRRLPLEGTRIIDVFEAAWRESSVENPIRWPAEEPEAEAKSSALALVRMYLRKTPIPPEEKPEAVEVEVEQDLGAHGLPTLVGVLDLVRAGGRIVDFKTAGTTPSVELALHSNGVQLTAYALLYRAATDRQETALELHHLIKTKTPKLIVHETGPATDLEITRFFRLVESYVRGVESDDYVPAPGFACASCEFFHECRRWP